MPLDSEALVNPMWHQKDFIKEEKQIRQDKNVKLFPVKTPCVLSCFFRVWRFVTLWTVACQACLSMGFSRQENWSRLPFLLQCRKVKSESEVAQSCPTLSDPMDCSLPGSSIHGIFQARVLEWVAIEIDVFLEISCFFHYPTDVGNLISGSSASSKPAWTSGSSRFTYCWSLAWRTSSIT